MTTNATDTNTRWRAEIQFRSDAGIVKKEHFFEEIEDLHEIIEQGPHWDSLIECTVTMNRLSTGIEGLTVEKAALL